VKWANPFSVGVLAAFVEGDPSKPGIYVQRVTFPPKMFSKPHSHKEDRHIVVLKGT